MKTAEDVLHAALQSNRRSLALLDAELRRASSRDRSLVEALAECEDDVMPAFYDVIGADGGAGISIPHVTVGPDLPFYGFWRLAPDAPFVATSIVCVQEVDANSGIGSVALVFDENVDSGPALEDSGDLGVLIFDVANNSQVISANFQNGVAAQMLPLQALMGQASAGVPGDMRVDEVVFPKAAALRVEAYVRSAGTQPNHSLRLHLILCGYKVFGD